MHRRQGRAPCLSMPGGGRRRGAAGLIYQHRWRRPANGRYTRVRKFCAHTAVVCAYQDDAGSLGNVERDVRKHRWCLVAVCEGHRLEVDGCVCHGSSIKRARFDDDVEAMKNMESRRLSAAEMCELLVQPTGPQPDTTLISERELWPGLVRWVSASETTNRGVSSHHRSPTLLPYCLTTADKEPRLAKISILPTLPPRPMTASPPDRAAATAIIIFT